MPRLAPPASVLALICIGLAGCGGDDGGGKDEEAIREVVRLSLTTDDVRADCKERLSSELIRKTYLTRTRCVRVQEDDEDDSADGVSFSRVEVDGDAATAGIRVRGGESDGATGELALVREDGDWRIDDISVPLLRSLVQVGLQLQSGGGGGLPAGARACVSRSLQRLPDGEFRRVAYQLIGETEAAERRTLQILAGCPAGGGKSFLARVFEQGVTQSLRRRGSSQGEIDCVETRLRAEISDEELTAALTGPNAQAAATRLISPAIAACNR